MTDVPNAKALVVTKGEIVFDDVHFNYGKEKVEGRGDIVDGFTLTVKAGEKVGLVGRSGAGKSTLANLLLRFYDLQSGAIRIDGQDIRRWAGILRARLRGDPDPRPSPFRPDNLRSHARRSLPRGSGPQKAHAGEFHRHWSPKEQGLDAMWRGGVKLRRPRQRVAIARVLRKNAPTWS